MASAKEHKRPPFFLTPIPYLMVFLFITIAPVHLFSRFLMDVHLELWIALAVISSTFLEYFVFQSLTVSYDAKLLLFLCLLLMGAPLVSSLGNEQHFSVLLNWEYLSWAKMLFLGPFLFLSFSGKRRGLLIETLLFSSAVLALIFWYRYGILHEVREYDLRPTLKMKNGDPNFICLLFVTPVPLVLYRISRILDPVHPIKLFYYGGILGLLLSGAIASESRMGIISLVIGLIYLLFALPRSLRRIALFLFLAVGGVILFFGGITERFVHIQDESNRMRIRTLINGFTLFSTSPAVGHGWDTAPNFFFESSGYPRLISETPPLAIHNTPLQILAELGTYGFLAFLGLFCFVTKKVREGERPLMHYATAALLIVFLNLLTLPLETKDFLLCLAFCLATLSSGLFPNRSQSLSA